MKFGDKVKVKNNDPFFHNTVFVVIGERTYGIDINRDGPEIHYQIEPLHYPGPKFWFNLADLEEVDG